eukprot:COSAG01_NODE_539_length_15749_cov_21.448307_12_plen_127_part_00
MPEVGVAQLLPHPAEVQVCGEAGSVLVMDSRCWHATPAREANQQRRAERHESSGEQPRVAVAVRYSPWWMNVEPLVPGGAERKRLRLATEVWHRSFLNLFIFRRHRRLHHVCLCVEHVPISVSWAA